MSRFDQDDNAFGSKLTGLGAAIERVNQHYGKEHHATCPMGVRLLATERPLCEHSMELCTDCQPCDCGHSFSPFIVGDDVKMRNYATGTVTGVVSAISAADTHSPARYFVDWSLGGRNQYKRLQLQRVL